MAFKHPVEPGAQSDVKLVDELVRRSLEINPGLRNGDTTHSFLRRLREQAVKQDAARKTSAPAVVTPTVMEDKRQQMVRLFLQQKTTDVTAMVDGHKKKLQEIEQARRDGLQKAVDEIIDLLMVVLSSGADATSTQTTLRDFRPLLAQLGVTETDFVRQARARLG